MTGPDPVDTEALIESHIGLARHLAARFADRGESTEDLIQVAFLGLVKAAHRYDPDRGVQFSTFATATISGELKRHFRDHRWGVRVARPLQDLFLSVRACVESMTHQLGRSPSMHEIAAVVGATVDEVVEAMEVGRSFQPVSVDAQGDRETDVPVAAQLQTEESGFELIDEREGISALLLRLTPRERDLIRMRFDDELTQSQIAARVGLSQMQVSRLLSRTLAQLRTWAEEDAEDSGGPQPPAARDDAMDDGSE